MTVVLIADYLFTQGGAAEALEPLRRMAAAVASREPGCIEYRISVDHDDPDHLLLYEEYRDEDALRAHRKTEHFRTFVEGEVAPLLRERRLSVYTRVL